MLTKEEGPNRFGNKLYTFDNGCVMEVPKEYQVKEIIGRGRFGIVCSAFNSSTNENVAIKKYEKLFDGGAKQVLRELMILNRLKHPNILAIKDIFRPTDIYNFDELYIVMELMEYDLWDWVHYSRKKLTLLQCKYIILELLFALQYIHGSGVLHRDIKPSNVLVNADLTVKLCDFDLARAISHDMTDYVVSRWYRSPELLLACRDYNYSVDIWSLGCLAVEMVACKVLFPGKNYKHQLTLISSLLGPPPTDRYPELTSVYNKEWHTDILKQKRSSLEELVPDLRRRFDEESFYSCMYEDGESNLSLIPITSHYEQFEDFILGLLKYKGDDRLTAKQAIMHPWLAEMLEGNKKWKRLVTSSDLINSVPYLYGDLPNYQKREYIFREIDMLHEWNRLNAEEEK